ncbi:hypothetical protein V6N13_064744 [Hibiscus sabdariffa]
MTCANPNVCVNPNARERTVNGGLEGSFGGRPPDAVAGDGNLFSLEKDVAMADSLVVGGYQESCGVSEVTTVDGDNTSEQRNLENLYGSWMHVVNKRRRNVNIQGSSGMNESHDVVEDRVEPQSIENNEVRAISREVQVANTVRSSGVSVSTSEVVATQRKQHVARGKMVGVAVDTEKVLVGHVNPAKIFDNRGVHIGGVKNVASHETVVKAASTLNSEKHVAVRVCMWRRNG